MGRSIDELVLRLERNIGPVSVSTQDVLGEAADIISADAPQLLDEGVVFDANSAAEPELIRPSREALRELGSVLRTQVDTAALLGISNQRLSQLVASGDITPSMVIKSLVGRDVHLFSLADIELIRATREQFPPTGRGPYSSWNPKA